MPFPLIFRDSHSTKKTKMTKETETKEVLKRSRVRRIAKKSLFTAASLGM